MDTEDKSQKEEPKPLRWLHLTDLHIGSKNEGQKTALTSLIDAIKEHSLEIPFDLVLLTGDLAFSGRKEEYEELDARLLKPLRSLPICANAKFISVPGNHDMDCSVGLPISWGQLGGSRQEHFFNLDSSGARIRQSRAAAFDEYTAYIVRAKILGVTPTSQPGAAIRLNIRDRNYLILPTVTCYFSDKDVPDQQKAPAPVHVIRALHQESFKEGDFTIVLGHHPMDWFMPETERPFHSLLVERNLIYLHGHEHVVRTKFGTRGLISLGFGAAYVSPVDRSSGPYYKNSFAICEVDDKLHVAVYAWDSNHGKWRADNNLPGDFIEKSAILSDAYCLPLPTTRLVQSGNRAYAAIAAAIRQEVSIDACHWIAENQPKRWVDLLVSLGQFRTVQGHYTLPTQTLPSGHVHFRIRDQRGDFLVRAISGNGDVLNYEQLQTINTEQDKQDYVGSLVVTLGTLSVEAKTLANQLATRKPLIVLERSELVSRASEALAPLQRKALKALHPSVVKVTLVITDRGFALVCEDRINGNWFFVIDEKGEFAQEASQLVNRLRHDLLPLKSLRYDVKAEPLDSEDAARRLESEFDRKTYLAQSLKYFDDVKYAPLAALGFRFRNASLRELYVSPSADIGGESKNTHALNRAVTEFLDSLNLTKAQRDQLESQLRSKYGVDRTAEVNAARSLYQKYNNVVVLGDPGSGKTCFVRNEILAYCDADANRGTWYSNHLPIYVSLAEAARLLDGNTDLVSICSIVAARRQTRLPKGAIESALASGQAAFFFDGLDEVGYLDRRISLVAEISGLVQRFAPLGCRFVLTSRPAAIQPVDIPDAFTYLQLRGLTEEEIRLLAGRVLTVRLGEGDAAGLSKEESELVERLVEDARSRPGISRLARNPLLLTLLVLIYANTGALSARRHMIYSQAIKTLVGVRGRDVREHQLSETDLRNRLGALALAIFDREVAEIPRRSEVVRVISPLMNGEEGAVSAQLSLVANEFLQEVAEATGLLTIHRGSSADSEDLITFMHYSFLEYYAAAGLLSRGYQSTLPRFSGNPRWRDVTTLLFGIHSEVGDVTPILRGILENESPSEVVSGYKLLLALDCACECDVPPEASQDLLVKAIHKSLTSGPGRYSAEFRSNLARRLEYFLQGTGPRIEQGIAVGLSSHDPIVGAAYADLVGRIGLSVPLGEDIRVSFQGFLAHKLPAARGAGLFAIERRPELRSDHAINVTRESLRGSVVERLAALDVLIAVPAFHQRMEAEVIELLEDSNEWVASLAAECMLINAWQGEVSDRALANQEKILAKLTQGDKEAGTSMEGVTLDRGQVEALIDSSNATESELAIRYLPLVRGDDQYVYQVLTQAIRSPRNARYRAAALDSFRQCQGAMNLITIADTDMICEARQASERNVRLAAIRLLGEMPDDEQVVRNLRAHLDSGRLLGAKEYEIMEAARALSRHVGRNQRLQTEVLASIARELPRNADSGFGDDDRQVYLIGMLFVCEAIGGVVDDAIAERVLVLAESYKTPIEIRRQAIRAFGRLAEPSEARVERVVQWLDKEDLRLLEATYAATASFLAQCRRKVEYSRRVRGTLEKFRSQLCTSWDREKARSPESIDGAGLRSLRDAIVDIEQLMNSYEEFSGRVQLQKSSSGEAESS